MKFKINPNKDAEKNINFCKKQKKLIRTEKAKEICEQKTNFIEKFIEQLEYETSNFFNLFEEKNKHQIWWNIC